MIAIKSFYIDDICIDVGVPTRVQEKEAMFALRKKEYLKRGYTSRLYRDGSDIDEYDYTEGCEYFIAENEKEIIGTVRLIRDFYLPTETKCFTFEEPEVMNKIPRENRAEISRLIVRSDHLFLPEHLVMLMLFSGMSGFGAVSEIEAGYAFIKTSLKRIFQKIKFPIHVIEEYTNIYSDKLLQGYFESRIDPPVPMYFLREEIDDALKIILAFKGIHNTDFPTRESVTIFPALFSFLLTAG